MELIALLLIVIISFFTRNNTEEVGLDGATSIISSLVFGFQPTVLRAVVYCELFFCFVSVVFSDRRY